MQVSCSSGRSTIAALVAGSLLGLTAHWLPAEDSATVADRATMSPEQVKAFETEIRPLLAQRCFKCHGPDKQNGGLRLDSQAAMLQGGETGPAIVPGKAADSLIVEAINYRSLEMPPKGKLPAQEIATLTEWIEAGALWPTEASQPEKRTETSALTDEDRAYWAFQPPRAAAPPDVKEAEAKLTSKRLNSQPWCRTDVDRFLLAKQFANGVVPNAEADRIALIRRVTEDVTGLPPTPEDVDAFRSDESPDAYERLVDRLLASERFGEHLAVMWLDLVRYAESDGYKQDSYRPTAWRYRDYVVRSFNSDKPYDQFVREQLAGDELDPSNPDALIATGFFRQGIYEYNQRDVRGQWRDMLIDVTDTVGDVFLATSVGCARCHDHKFDPVLQKDYFRLQAFFAGMSFHDGAAARPEELAAYAEQLRDWEGKTVDVRSRIDEFTRERFVKIGKGVIDKFAPELREVWARQNSEKQPGDDQILALMQYQIDEEINNFPKTLKGDDKEKWQKLHEELASFDSSKPAALPQARMIGDIGPNQPVVFIPDDERLGPVAPGFLSVLDESAATVEPTSSAPGSSGRRAAFATWLTRPDHPLTSRIIVNRIWDRLFGEGLVATPSDFGRLGEAPSHPELLDWLAVNFTNNGWRLKWLYRELLLSSAYRQSSWLDVPSPAESVQRGREIDPQNRLLWHFPVRRLSGEQIRDAALAASGELDLTAGGESSELEGSRRAIFTKVIRNRRDPLLDVFDFPERFASVAERHATTTPTQSLFLINGDWLLKRATRFAERITREAPGGDDSKVRLAYRLAYGREASPADVERATEFIYRRREGAKGNSTEETQPDQALVDVCHVLLNSSEFLYLD